MNIESIKAILSSPGWQDIEIMLKEEIEKGKSTKQIKTEGMSNEVIAREVCASNKAAKIIENFLKRLAKIKNPIIREKQSFR